MLLSIHSAASQSYEAKPRRREYLKRFQDLLNRIPLGTNLSRASDGNYSGKDERPGWKEHGRRPGAEFGRTNKIFRGPISGKISIFNSQEKHNFSLCSCFHAHPTTLLLKILRGTNAWAVPHLKFWGGPSPQSPLGLRPWEEEMSCSKREADTRNNKGPVGKSQGTYVKG